MPWVICRCGEKLKLQTESPEHINCPRCNARIRLRCELPKENAADDDGFIRFLCPCGRRLKVPAKEQAKAGRCPDCGRIVPVPTPAFHNLNLNSGKKEVETRTQDLDSNDLVELKKWSDRHRADCGQTEHDSVRTRPYAVLLGPNNNELRLPSGAIPRASVVKFETGLRICPQCGKPLHLGSNNCRECGIPVPRQ
jgi:predicted RNA-binding Zn-ribbon protein involved in translation (DUF1610 family)